jgi:hypothetical protein
MNRKFIAKEILLFISGLVILLISFTTLITINSFRNKKQSRIKIRTEQINDSIQFITRSIASADTTIRLEELYTYGKTQKLDVPETYDSFENTLLNDMNNRKIYYDYLKQNNIEISQDNFEKFNNYYFDSIGNEKSNKDKAKILVDSFQNKLIVFDSVKKNLNDQIQTSLNIKKYIITISIIIGSILYPLRLVIFLTIWSFKTLNDKSS